jgi:DUF1016 N-terminal domain
MSSFSHRNTAILAVGPTGVLSATGRIRRGEPVEPCNYAGKSRTLSDKFASSLEKVPTTSAQFETPALRYGRGFSKRNLEQMRLFYVSWPIAQTVSAQLTAPKLPLPWSAYVRLLSVTSEQARKFYEAEALRGGWSVRQLESVCQRQQLMK